MSAAEYKRLRPRFRNERQYELWLIRVFKTNGWLVTSMRDSRQQEHGADRGITDLICVADSPPHIVFAELKMPGKYPSKDQKTWLKALGVLASIINAAYGREIITVTVWRPADEDEAIRIAGGKIPL